eukprot:gb/GECH01014593.1/.p1 GENE.gb/GECH01014593.1/~~gb/GECH01014593.1/.p1  ORF type:complete len:610 (+),score=139.66 gb/GECH01014593.1/:1-1830(+)
MGNGTSQLSDTFVGSNNATSNDSELSRGCFSLQEQIKQLTSAINTDHRLSPLARKLGRLQTKIDMLLEENGFPQSVLHTYDAQLHQMTENLMAQLQVIERMTRQISGHGDAVPVFAFRQDVDMIIASHMKSLSLFINTVIDHFTVGNGRLDRHAENNSSMSGLTRSFSVRRRRDMTDFDALNTLDLHTILDNDSDARTFWENNFENTYAVDKEHFFKSLPSAIKEKHADVIKRLIDPTMDNLVTMGDFLIFLGWVGPFSQINRNINKLLRCEWFWGALCGTRAEHLLCEQPDGTYLVRFNDSDPGTFRVTCVEPKDGPVHYNILPRKNGVFRLFEGDPGKSDLQELIESVKISFRIPYAVDHEDSIGYFGDFFDPQKKTNAQPRRASVISNLTEAQSQNSNDNQLVHGSPKKVETQEMESALLGPHSILRFRGSSDRRKEIESSEDALRKEKANELRPLINDLADGLNNSGNDRGMGSNEDGDGFHNNRHNIELVPFRISSRHKKRSRSSFLSMRNVMASRRAAAEDILIPQFTSSSRSFKNLRSFRSDSPLRSKFNESFTKQLNLLINGHISLYDPDGDQTTLTPKHRNDDRQEGNSESQPTTETMEV